MMFKQLFFISFFLLCISSYCSNKISIPTIEQLYVSVDRLKPNLSDRTDAGFLRNVLDVWKKSQWRIESLKVINERISKSKVNPLLMFEYGPEACSVYYNILITDKSAIYQKRSSSRQVVIEQDVTPKDVSAILKASLKLREYQGCINYAVKDSVPVFVTIWDKENIANLFVISHFNSLVVVPSSTFNKNSLNPESKKVCLLLYKACELAGVEPFGIDYSIFKKRLQIRDKSL